MVLSCNPKCKAILRVFVEWKMRQVFITETSIPPLLNSERSVKTSPICFWFYWIHLFQNRRAQFLFCIVCSIVFLPFSNCTHWAIFHPWENWETKVHFPSAQLKSTVNFSRHWNMLTFSSAQKHFCVSFRTKSKKEKWKCRKMNFSLLSFLEDKKQWSWFDQEGNVLLVSQFLWLLLALFLSFPRSGTPNKNSHMRFFVEFQNFRTLCIIVKMIFGEKFSKWEFFCGFRKSARKRYIKYLTNAWQDPQSVGQIIN